MIRCNACGETFSDPDKAADHLSGHSLLSESQPGQQTAGPKRPSRPKTTRRED